MIKLIRRWIKGEIYGCGRCHHGAQYHQAHNDQGDNMKCSKCNCKAYHIGTVHWWHVLWGIYDD